MDDLIWGDDTHKANRVRHAIRESGLAEARVTMMKVQAALDPPRAAPFHFPYRDHRTVAETMIGKRKPKVW